MTHNDVHQDCFEMRLFLGMAWIEWIRVMHCDAFAPCPFVDTKHPIRVGNHKTSIACRWIEKPWIYWLCGKKERAVNGEVCVLKKHFLWSAHWCVGQKSRNIPLPAITRDAQLNQIARFLAFCFLHWIFMMLKLLLLLILIFLIMVILSAHHHLTCFADTPKFGYFTTPAHGSLVGMRGNGVACFGWYDINSMVNMTIRKQKEYGTLSHALGKYEYMLCMCVWHSGGFYLVHSIIPRFLFLFCNLHGGSKIHQHAGGTHTIIA